jgi:hypothetical protein
MKSRVFFVVAVAALVAGALWYYMPRHAPEKPPGVRPTPQRALAAIPPQATVEAPKLPPAATVVTPIRVPAPTAARMIPESQVIPLQDRTTHDFSYGAPPILRSGVNDDDSIARAMKEIAEATKDVTFTPDGKAQRAPGEKK